MNSFQKMVVIVLVVVLLIVCLVTFFVVHYAESNAAWPPIVSNCPDYWEQDDQTNLCINKKHLGTCQQDSMDFNVAPFNSSDGDCSKYNWATKCNVSWDGITYGVSNPCSN